MALGAQVIAEAAHRLAERHGVLIALHTDHCHPKNLKPFMDPLIEVSEARVARGEPPSSTATCSTAPSSRSTRMSRFQSSTWSAWPPST
jgi:fructose-bisphosphate aldolase class II